MTIQSETHDMLGNRPSQKPFNETSPCWVNPNGRPPSWPSPPPRSANFKDPFGFDYTKAGISLSSNLEPLRDDFEPAGQASTDVADISWFVPVGGSVLHPMAMACRCIPGPWSQPQEQPSVRRPWRRPARCWPQLPSISIQIRNCWTPPRQTSRKCANLSRGAPPSPRAKWHRRACGNYAAANFGSGPSSGRAVVYFISSITNVEDTSFNGMRLIRRL